MPQDLSRLWHIRLIKIHTGAAVCMVNMLWTKPSPDTRAAIFRVVVEGSLFPRYQYQIAAVDHILHPSHAVLGIYTCSTCVYRYRTWSRFWLCANPAALLYTLHHSSVMYRKLHNFSQEKQLLWPCCWNVQYSRSFPVSGKEKTLAQSINHYFSC